MGCVYHTITNNAVIVDGYPIEGSAYFIYCDRCGSFNISTRPTFNWIPFIVAGVVLAAVGCYLIMAVPQAGYGLMLWLAALCVFIFLKQSEHSHQCLKCGNTDITYQDVLHYSEHEILNSVIDVPYDKLHWHNKLPEKQA